MLIHFHRINAFAAELSGQADRSDEPSIHPMYLPSRSFLHGHLRGAAIARCSLSVIASPELSSIPRTPLHWHWHMVI
jgi:hypothetical protein